MEQPTSTENTPQQPARRTLNKQLIVTALVVVVALVGGIFGGIAYQKGKSTAPTATLAARDGMPGSHMLQDGGRGPTHAGILGSVTAVSSTSISVKNDHTGEVKTYNITSSTTINNNGSTVTYKDIAVGDIVMVTPVSDTSNDATTIRLNPTMGGPQSMSSDTPPTSTN